MKNAVRPARRRLVWVVALLFGALLTLVLLRKPLAAAAITSSLRMAGAGDIRLSVTEASPWGVLIENLGFQMRTQRFDARRVKVDRKHWWSASLGAVQIEALDKATSSAQAGMRIHLGGDSALESLRRLIEKEASGRGGRGRISRRGGPSRTSS